MAEGRSGQAAAIVDDVLAQALLGGALLAQQKWAEAEPHLLQGYQGMKEREAAVPAPARHHLAEALERLVRLYEAWGRHDQAAPFRAELAQRRKVEKKSPAKEGPK